MALSETAICAAGFGIVLSIICLVPYLQQNRNWTKNNLVFLPWIESRKEETLDFSRTADQVSVSKYPASWWTDEDLYQLECRAIFSKKWLFVTHASRFQKLGDYRTFEIAGFSFLVILGKDKQLRAFHNVCRHRAYAVTKKECGRSTVLGCRYHGWSYNTQGKLIKAPEFENVPGFDKDMNGLWEVAIEIRQSLLFVNLEAGEPQQRLDLGSTEVLLAKWKISDMKCISDWKFEAAFNWKLLGTLMSDHTHNQISALARMVPYWMRYQQEDTQMLHTTLVRRLASGRILTIKALPKSAKTSMVECSIFSKYPKNPRQLEELKTRIYHDIERLESMQRRVSLGQEPLSSLAPSMTEQDEIDVLLKAHREYERMTGSEIHPAARTQNFTLDGKADDDFCRELENPDSVCGANAKGLLDW
ncbi:ISP domain-containing protein [Mollisia scopiformis]|uniref:ISP domain-containing protein n=1 Tax=Mollisia scopiformis TaxID=149040 RepID=A0A132B7R5_MOLSC|nr:ISP domain-containing protein [Mollisia scopiformis]KUJ08293.1 ISP domain-containing protein [Mollisia scopiformis]